MNRHFLRDGGWPEFPSRSFARVDYVEPGSREDGSFVVGFDAVDADWPGFQSGFFELATAEQRVGEISQYWRAAFSNTDRVEPDFDGLPLYHLEVTVPESATTIEELQSLGWLELQLGPGGKIPVAVFGGLFAEPVQTFLHLHLPWPTTAASPALNLLFNSITWPNATNAELKAAVSRPCRIEQLIVFDVGQGSANAIVCECGYPVYYFDVGCGVYRNKNTCPPVLTFCTCDHPIIILSHWDSDHWSGATQDPRLLSATWIAPQQSITTRHVTFANKILNAGGKLLIVGPSLPHLTWGHKHIFQLKRCTGPASDRNRSGLVLTVEDTYLDRAWLLTGDASYDVIPGPLPTNLSAVVVPHHGAGMATSIPAPAPATDYARLLYSFGPGNAHGQTNVRHPVFQTIQEHVAVGWTHGAWQTSPPGSSIAGVPVLATAAHLTTHLGGAAAGWAGVPGVPVHLATCPDFMPVTQS